MAQEVVFRAFKGADLNNDGSLNIAEFTALLVELEPDTWSEDKLALFFRAADKDGSGCVNVEELIGWLFPKKREPCKDDADDDDDESATSDDSSESEGEDAQAKELMRRKLSEKAEKVKSKNTDVTLLDEEELYTFLTLVDGRPGGPLKLASLLDYFHLCKTAGMGPRLTQLVQQNRKGEVDESFEPEDVSPLELGKLFELVANNRKATEEDARMEIDRVKEECRALSAAHEKLDISLAAAKLDGESVVGFGVFKQLLQLLVKTMCISRNNMVSCFTWSRSGIYQMTESVAIQVLEKLFIKVPKNGQDILAARVTCNDFSTLLYGLDLVSAPGKTGIPMGRIALIWGETLKHMRHKLAERKNLRIVAIGGRVKQGRQRKHNHRHITGRSQLSILMDALFEALPAPKKYHCSLDMVLGFLAAPPTPISPASKKKKKIAAKPE